MPRFTSSRRRRRILGIVATTSMIGGLLQSGSGVALAWGPNDPYNGGVGCWVEQEVTWKEAIKIGQVHTWANVTGTFDYKTTSDTTIEGAKSVDYGVTWTKTSAKSVSVGVGSSIPIPQWTHADVMSDFKFGLFVGYCRVGVSWPIAEDYREVKLLSAYGNQVLKAHARFSSTSFPNCKVVNDLHRTAMAAGGTWYRQEASTLTTTKTVGLNVDIKGLSLKATTKYTAGLSTSITISYTSAAPFWVCGQGASPQDTPVVAAIRM